MRNPNGYGNIIKLSGNRRRPWAVRVSVPDERGRPKLKYLSYHEKQIQAVEALEEYRKQKQNGTAPNNDAFSITLAEVYALWSARKFPRISPQMVSCYKAAWSHMKTLHNVRVRDINIDDIQAIIDTGEQAGRSKSSLDKDSVLIKALFQTAMERDYIAKDYSAFIQLPHVDAKYEKGAFNDLQLKQIQDMAQAGVPWADTVLMLCYTGFRITEFLTLTRFSYDKENNALRGGMKTNAGKNRLVPVHPKIKPYLDKWLAQNGECLICDAAGKPITSSRYRTYAFAPIMQQIGCPQATPHWCRHTFASLLHAAHAPELDIKRLLGHAHGDVTEHYTHVDIKQLQAAINLIA